ncbi:hypothetical protein [Novosphingobium aquimarinum]|uniref:hypothetical protein n=1 Tax=Novosphingobium aquimarinum TaxID=2682494 RepID=UPI0012EB4391|nr:hypothetical protein [Novosphingobium aquimarinum]
MSASLAEMLAAPQLLPHALDETGARILLLQFEEQTLREASFLDQRSVGPQPRGSWQDLETVLAAIDPKAPDDADYIFHLGHVGSTLIARLLGAVEGVLALREPQILRSLAEIESQRHRVECPWDPALIDARIAKLRRLLARRFHPGERVIVKATSFASQIATCLLAPDAKALFLQVSAASYLQTILAGENSRKEAVLLAPKRLVRLEQLLPDMPWRLWSMREGELIALGWLVEMLTLDDAARQLPGGCVHRVDFDAFLAEPIGQMLAMARHVSLPLDEAAAQRLVEGPLMTRYSKAPEHSYSPQLRHDLQRQAAQEHRAAIAQALTWLEAGAARYPRIARILEPDSDHVQTH